MEPATHNGLIIDDENDVTVKTLRGHILCNPDLALLDFGNVIVRKDYQTLESVRIMSGMGSGHDPTPCGFVGDGMLTASVQGKTFNSPPWREILQTIKEVTLKSDEGVLVIIGNNNSERLNFGLATERAKSDGVRVKLLIVADENKETGQYKECRGLGGIVLMYKIAGALAKEKKNLKEIYKYCNDILPDLTSILVCLKPCSSPSVKTCVCTRHHKQNEIQIGTGLHGEPGVKKLKLTTYDYLSKELIEEITNKDLTKCFELDPAVPVVLLVNNMGSTEKTEELKFLQAFVQILREREIQISRIYSGRFFTALDMSGFCVTLLKVKDPLILTYLDAPCQTSGWNKTNTLNFNPDFEQRIPSRVKTHREHRTPSLKGPKLSPRAANIVSLVLQFACNALMSCERQLNKIDSEVGDGDSGSQFKCGCEALLKELELDRLKTTHPFTFLEYIGKILEVTMGGAAGLIYATLFEAAAQPFAELPENHEVDANLWMTSLRYATNAVKMCTGATEGNRSLYTPLYACVKTFSNILSKNGKPVAGFGCGVYDAEQAALKTRQPLNKHPDAGAHAVGIWLRAVYEAIKLRCED